MNIHPNRRTFLKSIFVAGTAPWFVPARVLGADGATKPSNQVTLGVIGVGAQGQSDLRDFLRHKDVRVTAICDVNKRNVESARGHIAKAYGSPDVKVFADFRELNAEASIDAVLMALPVHWHSLPALDAILHGKHIY
ncbi:MAG: Gfo/Idh/MocA family oxidoreductase, partial [Verrucomicrobia bacterium]|nr:Gfo/Idh/MocA family oxidoreductase [Verrucomicrobiota bacterium]